MPKLKPLFYFRFRSILIPGFSSFQDNFLKLLRATRGDGAFSVLQSFLVFFLVLFFARHSIARTEVCRTQPCRDVPSLHYVEASDPRVLSYQDPIMRASSSPRQTSLSRAAELRRLESASPAVTQPRSNSNSARSRQSKVRVSQPGATTPQASQPATNSPVYDYLDHEPILPLAGSGFEEEQPNFTNHAPHTTGRDIEVDLRCQRIRSTKSNHASVSPDDEEFFMSSCGGHSNSFAICNISCELMNHHAFNFSATTLACQEKFERECGGPHRPEAAVMIEQSALTAQLVQLTNDCESTANNVERACSDTPSDMTSTLRLVAEQTSQMVGQSALDQCSAAAQAASATQSALSSMRLACGASFDSCRSRCERANAELQSVQAQLNQNPQMRTSNPGVDGQISQFQSRIRSGNTQCHTAQGHLRNVEQNLSNVTRSMETSSQCAASLAANGQAPLTFDQCQLNPNQVGCELFKGISNANCSDPQFAATSLICICQRNPNAPQCSGISQKSGGLAPNGGFESHSSGETATAGATASLGGSPFGGGFGPGGSEMEFPEGVVGNPNEGIGPGGMMGAGGAGMMGVMGAANQGRPLNEPYRKPTVETPGSRLNTNVIGRGGGGGLLGAIRNAFGRGGGQAIPSNSNNPVGSDLAQKKTNPDLTQFLPGGLRDPKRRSLSSTFGPDGITGPFTDNFKKINVRYINLGHSLR